MILVYALGGGAGHLVRMRSALDALGEGAPYLVIGSSPWLDLPAPRGVFPEGTTRRLEERLRRDRAGVLNALEALGQEHRPSEVWLDAFPAGVLGELSVSLNQLFPKAKNRHFARRMRWARYLERLADPMKPLGPFDETIILEPLEPGHLAALRASSRRVVTNHELGRDPALTPLPDALHAEFRDAAVVVHTGDEKELALLTARAHKERERRGAARVVVCTPERAGFFPLRDLFESAAFVVTAAGFNSVRQSPGPERHVVVPLERRFDDQAWRAQRFVSGASAR